MKCPRCKVSLIKTKKLDIPVDYCPQCRGVWLDGGEMEKIMEMANCPTDYKGSEEDKEHPYYFEENRFIRKEGEEKFDFEHKGPKKQPKRSYYSDIKKSS